MGRYVRSQAGGDVIVRRERVARALPGYVVGRQLGSGAFGLVLAGRHRRLRRPVAIKVMEAEGPEGTKLDFVAEAQVLAGLDHPHVVRAYDYVEAEGLCLVVMELLPGGTLTRRWREMSGEQACAVGLAVAAALAHTHARGILHRDIKADNILFAADGTVKVSDFGIAKLFDGTAATASGQVGTPMYMAPEQIEGGRLSPATDLYALGVVLYRLLTGTAPFDPSQPVQALWRQHLTEPPPPMRGVPPLIASVVRRALAKDPAARQADAAAFAVDLADAATASYGPGWSSRAGLPLHLDDAVRRAADLPPGNNGNSATDASGTSGRAAVRTGPRRPLSGRRGVVASLATITLLAVLAVVIWAPGGAAPLERAEVSRRLAAEASKIADDQPDLARRLAVAAYQVSPTTQARSSVLTLLTSGNQSLPSDAFGSVSAMAFSPDKKLLATSAIDFDNNRRGIVQLWDMATRGDKAEPLATFAASTQVSSYLMFSPDGKVLAAGSSDNAFRVWDATARGEVTQALATFTGSTDGLIGILFSRDGKLLATGNTTTAATSTVGIRIWDATARGEVTQPLATFTGPNFDASNMMFSPDGRALAASSYDTVQVWDATARGELTQPVATLSGSTDGLTDVQFSPDGKLLAAGSIQDIVQVWDATARGAVTQPLSSFTGSTGPVEDIGVRGYIRFSPDGKLLAAGSSDNTLRVWDATARGHVTQPLTTLIGHTNVVTDMEFSPDGKLLATSSEDGTSRAWDMAARGKVTQPLTTLRGSPGGEVSTVAFSPDGWLLATNSFNSTAWLWDLDADRLVENACAETANWLSEAEWKAVVADTSYDPPCA